MSAPTPTWRVLAVGSRAFVVNARGLVAGPRTLDSARAAFRAVWGVDPEPITDPVPEDGYVFRSSRRYPRAPETVIFARTSWHAVRWVGLATVDGSHMYAFRAVRTRADGRKQVAYLFGLPQNIRPDGV